MREVNRKALVAIVAAGWCLQGLQGQGNDTTTSTATSMDSSSTTTTALAETPVWTFAPIPPVTGKAETADSSDSKTGSSSGGSSSSGGGNSATTPTTAGTTTTTTTTVPLDPCSTYATNDYPDLLLNVCETTQDPQPAVMVDGE